jgi:hypothetical protein
MKKELPEGEKRWLEFVAKHRDIFEKIAKNLDKKKR